MLFLFAIRCVFHRKIQKSVAADDGCNAFYFLPTCSGKKAGKINLKILYPTRFGLLWCTGDSRVCAAKARFHRYDIAATKLCHNAESGITINIGRIDGSCAFGSDLIGCATILPRTALPRQRCSASPTADKRQPSPSGHMSSRTACRPAPRPDRRGS